MLMSYEETNGLVVKETVASNLAAAFTDLLPLHVPIIWI